MNQVTPDTKKTSAVARNKKYRCESVALLSKSISNDNPSRIVLPYLGAHQIYHQPLTELKKVHVILITYDIPGHTDMYRIDVRATNAVLCLIFDFCYILKLI